MDRDETNSIAPSEVRLDRFDQIRIQTTQRIRYVASPPGKTATPHGIWTVAGFIAVDGGHDILATKNETVIRVPPSDVVLVRKHNINDLIDRFRNMPYGQKAREEASDSRPPE